MEVVTRVFNDLRPALNISKEPILLNVSPLAAKSYLMENPPRFCVLVVNFDNVQGSYEHWLNHKAEYEDLFRTAVGRVGKLMIFPLLTHFRENTPNNHHGVCEPGRGSLVVSASGIPPGGRWLDTGFCHRVVSLEKKFYPILFPCTGMCLYGYRRTSLGRSVWGKNCARGLEYQSVRTFGIPQYISHRAYKVRT